MKNKKQLTVRNYCHYLGEYREVANNICNLKYCALKKIPLDFHYGANQDYHYIMKELVEEVKNNLLV